MGKIVGKNWLLTNPHLTLQIGKALGLFLFRRFVVDIHRRGYIGVSHDFLNDLQVGFILAKPSAECVPQIVNGEMR